MQERERDTASRLLSARILWLALLGNVGILFAFTLVQEGSQTETSNRILTLAFPALAMIFVVVSFAVKKKLLAQAVEKQQIDLVRTAYTAALAICEVGALLGLLDFFLNNNQYYFILFVIAAFGMALHFPRRDDFLAATFKAF
jgi:hypothetical protein